MGSNEALNLASAGLDVVEHVHRVREVLLVPNHVLVVLGMLDVEPENVNGDIFFVEALLYTPDVVGTDIIPSALVITQRPMWRKLNRSGQFRILTENLIWRGSGEQEDVKNTRLGDPVGFRRLFRGMSDIDPGFRSDCDEDRDGRIRRVRVDQGNRPVQRHGGRSKVLEDVGVVESVWVIEECAFAFGSWKVQTGSMLRDTINVAMIGEVDIEGKRLGTCTSVRLGVGRNNNWTHPLVSYPSMTSRSLATDRPRCHPRTRRLVGVE